MKDMQNALRIYVYNKLILGKLTLKKGVEITWKLILIFLSKFFGLSCLGVFSQHWLNYLDVDNKNGWSEIEIQSLESTQCLQAKVCNFLNYDLQMVIQA